MGKTVASDILKPKKNVQQHKEYKHVVFLTRFKRGGDVADLSTYFSFQQKIVWAAPHVMGDAPAGQ